MPFKNNLKENAYEAVQQTLVSEKGQQQGNAAQVASGDISRIIRFSVGKQAEFSLGDQPGQRDGEAQHRQQQQRHFNKSLFGNMDERALFFVVFHFGSSSFPACLARLSSASRSTASAHRAA